ncbi:MAG: hypothetical protein ABSG78_13670 [Verrucomicrobiota bacterium]|jgi:hypothetical protein
MQEPPKVKSDVERVVREDFAPEQFASVMFLLDQIKKEPQEDRLRYQFNLLKLCSGDIELLHRSIPMTFKATHSEVEETVHRDFPRDQFAEAMSVLDMIKKDAEDLRAHFQLHVLKLSQGRMDLLRQNVETCDKKSVGQPHPKVTSKHVERIVRRDFPAEQFSEVMAALSEYGKESYENEADRVRLAILKLARGKLDLLQQALKTAKTDYRDVITWAEYPGYSKRWDTYKLPAAEKQQIIDQDWQQYLAWANAK